MKNLQISIVCLVAFLGFNNCLSLVSNINKLLSPKQLTKTPEPALIPDKCSTSFDAAGFVGGEIMMFKDKYFWNLKYENAIEIRIVWSELPTTMTHVDAVFEADDKLIWFFIGHEIYIFQNSKLSHKLSLQDLGINLKHYSKIDAIFLWPFNNKTYIFSDGDYWQFDGTKVNQNYPKKINETWQEVFNINTAFSNDGILYFLKDNYYHEFDSRCMQINRMRRYNIGLTFLNCVPAPVLENRRNKANDVIREPGPTCEEKFSIEKSASSQVQR